MKMNLPLLFCLFVLLASCTNASSVNSETQNEAQNDPHSSNETPEINFNDSIPLPAGYNILGQAKGDLDKDNVAERVLVYNTNREGDAGSERELHIYRSNKSGWELWHKAVGPVLSSESGGVMGDPFREVKIENGCIVLYHDGGSRFKWSYVHRFRYQNNAWELIGATSHFGAPCESWESFDYNLSTGKIEYKKEEDPCEGKTAARAAKTETFTNKLANLPKMDNFQAGSNDLKLAKLNLNY